MPIELIGNLINYCWSILNYKFSVSFAGNDIYFSFADVLAVVIAIYAFIMIVSAIFNGFWFNGSDD